MRTHSLSSRLYSSKAHSSLPRPPTVFHAHTLPPTVSLFSTSSQPSTTEQSTKQSTETEDSDKTKDLRRLRIALIVGPAWFVFLMYMCFIREEKGGGIVDYLSQDPRHNQQLPQDIQEKAKELYGNSDEQE